MPFRPAAPHRTPIGLAAAALVLGIGWAGPLVAQPAATPAASATASPETVEIQRLIKDGQHAQALKLIDDSLAKNPKDAQMRFRRGVVLSMLDRKSEALAVFQKLVEDHPELPGPYNNLAVLYGAQGDYEKARQTLEKAIHTNPAYATAYQNLGDVYAQLASQAYSKALQVDGKTEASVQPKLALLRELIAGPNTAPTTAAAAVKPAAKPPTTTVATATTVAANKPSAPPPAVAPPPPPAAVATAKPTPPPPPLPASTGASTKPASAAAFPPAAPVAAAKPTAAPASAAAAAPSGTAEVEAAVRAWAAAWAKRDMAAYYAAYTPEFSGQASSRKAWEQDRRDRIATRKQIKVDLQDLRVSVNGDQATAKFKQVYASDALSATSRKTLQLVRTTNGRWVIKQEAVAN